MSQAVAPRLPLAAISILSAAVLGYEVLLMRLFSIIQWHHFAYLMISIALLGYGAAGTLVALAGERLLQRWEPIFVAALAAFGVSAVAAFHAAQRIPFNPLEFLWDPAQSLRFLAMCALLVVPFFLAASALCLSFWRAAESSHRIYAADVAGAGVGSIAIVLALQAVEPAGALQATGAAGIAAAAVAAWRFGLRRTALALAGAALAAAITVAMPPGLKLNEYKDLSQALRLPDARIVAEASGPLGHIAVVESPRVPFRMAPGLSLASKATPPAQLGLFVDGDGPGPIQRFEGDLEPLGFLRDLTSALPYHIAREPRVLIIGAGSGTDVLQAVLHQAAAIDALEADANAIRMIERTLAGFTGRPLSQPRVRAHVGEARGFLAQRPDAWDVIQLSLVDAGGAAGVHALRENYLYTIEAFMAYLDHLNPGGVLSITRATDLPPRDVVKLLATAAAALRARGVEDPGNRIALIRGWSTATMLVRHGPFTAEEIAAVRAFSRARSFDLAWHPGIEAADANRFNALDRPYYFEAARALLGADSARFIEQHKFHVAPATDDSPYFFRYFRWSSLPELWSLRAQGAAALIDWGYPVLLASLFQAVGLSLLLILLPLLGRRRTRARPAIERRARLGAYFLCLGLGFMFIEIAFIQRLGLFLGHPIYAAAAVLGTFLLFAGLGSRAAHRRALAREPGRTPRWPFLAIAALCATYLGLMPMLLDAAAGTGAVTRLAITIGLLAPLAFGMGIPFPAGLRRSAAIAPAVVPWAWAVNGCASVVGAVLATLVAVHWGFSAVVGSAAALYIAASVLRP